MELLLLEDFPSLGYVGDIVTVKNGYARNHLVPQGIGVEANSRRGKYFKHLQEGALKKKERLKSEAEEFAKEVQKHKLSFKLKMGEQGKSFGSISLRDILKELNSKGGYSFDKKQLRLNESIKTPGVYQVALQLHSEVSVDLEVDVQAIKQKAVAPKDKSEKKEAQKSSDAIDSLDEGDTSGSSEDESASLSQEGAEQEEVAVEGDTDTDAS